MGELGVLYLWTLTIIIMLALYKSFILPHLEYCSPPLPPPSLLGVGKVQVKDTDRAREIIVLPRTIT